MHHQVNPDHFARLINLFATAPVQQIFAGSSMQLEEGVCRIQFPVTPSLFHGAGALHGSAYFKLLDDAAYFAAATASPTYFLLTAKFDIKLLRPVHEGLLTAVGNLESVTERVLTASARLLNESGQPVATGTGQFAFSTIRWENLDGYSS